MRAPGGSVGKCHNVVPSDALVEDSRVIPDVTVHLFAWLHYRLHISSAGHIMSRFRPVCYGCSML